MVADSIRRLVYDPDDRSEALFALQKGVRAALPPEKVTVEAYGCLVLGLDSAGFRSEVKTVMVNGKVVDHPETAGLASGDTIVFSGAMPGLVGAMLRSDSPLKAMRGPVTAGGSGPDGTEADGSGAVTIKAFNTVLRNHLEDIIRYGVSVEGESDG